MKQIDDWFFDDNFTFDTITFHGIEIYSDGKHVYLDKNSMLYSNAIGRVCEKCSGFVEGTFYTICEKCKEKSCNEKYSKLEIVEPTKVLYSDLLDEFFENDDWTLIYDYLGRKTYDQIIFIKFDSLRIHPCEKCFASTIDIQDCFEEAPEEFDLDSYTPIEEIRQCIDRVNDLIREHSIGYTPIMDKKIHISDSEWLDMRKAVIEEYNENE